MNIAIYGRPVNNNQLALAENVLTIIRKSEKTIAVHEPYLKFLHANNINVSNCQSFTSHSDLKADTDFLLSIGGDGTLLDTVFLVKESNIPVVGINAGRLGFLSSISKENLEDAINSLSKGHFSIDARTLLRLESNHPIFEGENIALNEFTLHKKDT
jgi:NAD+ kinase